MHQPFTLRVEPTGALLYSRRTHAYTRRSAAESFLCAASAEVGATRAVQILRGNVGDEEADAAYLALAHEGVFDDNGRFQGRVVEVAHALDGAFAAPLVAHLGVTLACNFSCAHCYSSSGKRAPDELTLDEIDGLIHQLAEMGTQKLVLGGGEPFIRKELPLVVRHADAAGVDTYVHTNASLVKEKSLRALAECPPAGLSVSLDGPDADVNDVIRGEGAFEQARAGLELLRKHYAPGFNVSMTITPVNATTAARMVELAHDEGARVLMLRPAYPAGEAARAEGGWCDRDTFARAIDLARARAAELGMEMDAPHPYEQGVPDFDGFGCVASRIVLGITPRGEVTPCLNLPGEFIAGNVRESTLADLWRSGGAFAQVRNTTGNAQCASCRHNDTCRGGCRVRALFVGNGLAGPDAWCHYEPLPGHDPVPFVKPSPSRLRVVA